MTLSSHEKISQMSSLHFIIKAQIMTSQLHLQVKQYQPFSSFKKFDMEEVLAQLMKALCWESIYSQQPRFQILLS
jgi:hypothetical protein